MRATLPDFAGPEVALPREAFEALVSALDELSFLEPSDFLFLGLVTVVRGSPVLGSIFSLSASSANKELEFNVGRPKERVELKGVVSVLDEDAQVGLSLAHGGSWKIVNVGDIVLIDVESVES